MGMNYDAARLNLVHGQVQANDVPDRRVQEAFAKVPRERFVPKDKREFAYAEMDIEVAPGRKLTEVRDIAKLIQAAKIRSYESVLVIGAATGYTTALVAELGETVVALESDPTLVKRAETILAELHVDNAVVIEGPLRDGAAKHGPFDVIIIDGQVPEVPRHLLSQLSENGRLLTFVGTPVSGHAVLVEYRSGAASDRNLFDAVAPRLAEFETESQFEF